MVGHGLWRGGSKFDMRSVMWLGLVLNLDMCNAALPDTPDVRGKNWFWELLCWHKPCGLHCYLVASNWRSDIWSRSQSMAVMVAVTMVRWLTNAMIASICFLLLITVEDGETDLSDELIKCLPGNMTKRVVFSCVHWWSVQKGHDTDMQTVQKGHDASGRT